MADVITDDDIRRAVSPNAFEAGRSYQREQRVQHLRVEPDGSSIEAVVVGNGPRPYVQMITVHRSRSGRVSASGACSCPVGTNCKHVAAALFAYQERTRLPSSPVPLRPRQPGNPGSGKSASTRDALGLPGPAQNQVTSSFALPHDVEAWLRGLDAAQQEESEDYPASVRKRLLYVLDRGGHFGSLMVNVQSVELNSAGRPVSPARRHQPEQLMRGGQQPKFLRPSDRVILQRLPTLGLDTDGTLVATLQRILATGRGRWAAWDGPVVTEGAPVAADLGWKLAEDGSQRPQFTLPEPLIGLWLASPWYVDPATGRMGPIETTLPARLVRAMLASPALPPEAASRVREEMGRRWPNSSLPAPKPIAPPRPIRERLQPHLLLFAGELPFAPSAPVAAGRTHATDPTAPRRVALARLSWRYGPVRLPASAQWQPDRIVQRDGMLYQVIRDRPGEGRAVERLHQAGLGWISQHHPLPTTHPHAGDLMLLDPDLAAWIDVVLDDVPRLREDGWLVEIAGSFPLQLVEPTGDISFEVREGSGLDWFDLDLGVMLDGQRINLVPAVLEFIADAGLALSQASVAADQVHPLLLPLPDGRVLTVSLTTLQPILSPMLELFAGAEVDEVAGFLRLSRRNAADLALLEEASAGSGIAWTGGEAVRALGRQLREHGGIPPCRVPDRFQATLRGYQEHGLAWLQFLRSAGLGGVLADDMGLGKTVQTLAHLVVEQAEGRLDRPALIVCPTSLVPNWQAETARFAPSLRVLVLHGPDRSALFSSIEGHDLVITTYPLLSRDHAVLTAQDWHVVVLDEAQTIKNPLATTSRLARTLRARQRLCLSGTPLENHLGDLWSLFDFLAPGFLGDRKQFGWRYRGPIEKAGNVERQAMLAQRIAPFLLRRTKEQVAPELPSKTDITETVQMGDGQRALYEGIRLAMHAKVRAAIARRGMAGSGIIILDALLKLRQACCDPRLLKLATAKAAKARSAKLERLLELLPQMLEEGRRVLLFSQFTSMLALIEAELARLGVPYVLLTGDTRNRAVPIRQFQSGEVKLFLISLKAGGVGLNLTAADTVIHYDPWWNPAVENQATDRAHRIGQEKPVFVHRLITAGTIEEKMEVLKRRKQALASGVLGASGEAGPAFTEEDLDMLFEPVGGAS